VTGDLVDVVTAIVRSELRKVHTAELGVVTALAPHAADGDKANYACDVRLRDSGLELRRVPVATARIGLVAIPNVDDLVLVQFVGGDLHGAVITGRLYNDVDRPPVAAARECVYECPDPADSGVRRLAVKLPNGNTLIVDDDTVVVDVGGTTITVKNGGDVEVASKAKVVIKSAGATEVASDGDLSLKASGAVTVEAGGDLTLKGMSVSVVATTSAKLEGSASATVKGATVKIAGLTDFAPG
jgi:phage baseplate assembly protein gpV